MQIHTSEPGPGVAHLSLDGRLTLVSAPQLRTAITEAVDGGRTRVVVDLTKVGFMDSSGLGALVAGLKKARQEGGDLRLTGVNQQVSTVLELTNLDRVLQVHATVEEATHGW